MHMLQSADGATPGLTQGQHRLVKKTPRINPGKSLPTRTFRFPQIPPAEAAVARHLTPDKPKLMLPPCSMLISSQKNLTSLKNKLVMQTRMQKKAKLKTQSVYVHMVVYVVFGVCAHSSKSCTWGQASVHHVNSATRHSSSALVTQRHD